MAPGDSGGAHARRLTPAPEGRDPLPSPVESVERKEMAVERDCVCGHSADLHRGQTIDDDGMCHRPGCECVNYRKLPERIFATFMVKVEYDPSEWDLPNYEQDTVTDHLASVSRPTEGGDVWDVQWSVAKVEVT